MELQNLFLVGINYKKSDAAIRGKFALNEDQYIHLLQKALEMGLNNVFVISTCNRTEIYGIAPSAQVLSDLICGETEGDSDIFSKLSYIRQSREAAEHLFEVAAGLDSQILGDYEILGQIKQAIKIAKEQGTLGTFLDRLTNMAVQASKEVKNKTSLSGGTISVSFAAIQFLKWHVSDFSHKKIVVLGTGKIGSSTIKNIVDYLHTRNITLINRTGSKAFDISQSLNLRMAPYDQFEQEIADADIIVTATNAPAPVINGAMLTGKGKKILVDLGIPNNIATDVKALPGIILVNVDELSKINDQTYAQRAAQVPAAQAILQKHMNEFLEWHRMRKNAPVLKAAKATLMELHKQGIPSPFLNNRNKEQALMPAEIAMQKAINNMALKLRNQKQKPGCDYIEAINDYISSTEN